MHLFVCTHSGTLRTGAVGERTAGGTDKEEPARHVIGNLVVDQVVLKPHCCF